MHSVVPRHAFSRAGDKTPQLQQCLGHHLGELEAICGKGHPLLELQTQKAISRVYCVVQGLSLEDDVLAGVGGEGGATDFLRIGFVAANKIGANFGAGSGQARAHIKIYFDGRGGFGSKFERGINPHPDQWNGLFDLRIGQIPHIARGVGGNLVGRGDSNGEIIEVGGLQRNNPATHQQKSRREQDGSREKAQSHMWDFTMWQLQRSSLIF